MTTKDFRFLFNDAALGLACHGRRLCAVEEFDFEKSGDSLQSPGMRLNPKRHTDASKECRRSSRDSQWISAPIDNLDGGAAMQNTSHAVMAQRTEPSDSPDDFPTPPWATRALLEHIIAAEEDLSGQSCLEPACGAGHMAKVLKEYFREVRCSDAYDYGFGPVRDYLTYPYETNAVDWVITNPPFRLAEEFVLRSLRVARRGVAILARTVFLESVGRYNRIFRDNPPAVFAQFVERVPMVKGRLDAKASTATGYAWLLWEKGTIDPPRLVWVPPCRKQLERASDYPNVANTRKKALIAR